MMRSDFTELLLKAIEFRRARLIEPHDSALRLLNGFTENLPGLTIDIFAGTAVICDYSANDDSVYDHVSICSILKEQMPWIKTVILKKKCSDKADEKNGIIICGVKPDTRIQEFGVKYAVNLTMNQDNSFYHDTRFLRRFLLDNCGGMTVLNTFAYTGSLGVAAFAGGAADVVQSDLSDKFLELAQRSYHMNDIKFRKSNFIYGDFFQVTGKFRKERKTFDCIILDPPFFSKTSKGVVDMAGDPAGVINKVRPLINDGGLLIVVNNSLYLSGAEFLARMDSMCDDVYLTRELIIPVPDDFTGANLDYLDCYQHSPLPFNHPTKIVVLRVKRG